jgi:succinoglycan biosynthesis transport protein ExoP
MLRPVERQDEGFRAPAAESGSPSREEGSEIDRLLAAARRQARVLIACSVLALALGIVYVATTIPQYTAGVSILIDDRAVRAFTFKGDGPDINDSTGSHVDSEVELLRSNRIAFAVIDKLQLYNDPEFGRAGPGLIGRLKGLVFGSPRPDSAPKTDEAGTDALRLNALGRFLGNLDVRRVQRTLVLEIRFRSADREKAALIANTIADAYLTDQLNSRYEATQRASGWLIDRIAELKQKVLTSDLAIQKFRADHDLISVGGKLVGEQQLGEVNSQLVAAAAETAKAEARYARIKSIVDSGKTDAIVT